MSHQLHPEDEQPIPEGGSLAIPLGEGIEPLAKIWRETNDDEVARCLVNLSAAYASFHRKLPKKGSRFDEIAGDAKPRMLTVLLESITYGHESRAADRLMTVWRAYGIDPRTRLYLDRWRARKPRPYSLSFDAMLDVVHGEWNIELGERAPTGRKLTDADRTALGRADDLLSSMPKRRAALQLLREVYAHPKDLSRRIVLSDALMELGDSWGELIAIQCARKLGTGSGAPDDLRKAHLREAQLLASPESHAWLGRLRPSLFDKPAPTFECGFPATVAPNFLPRSVGVREWGTITKLEATGHYGSSATTALSLLQGTRSPALREVALDLLVRDFNIPRFKRMKNRAIEHLRLRLVPIAPGHAAVPMNRNTLFEEWSNIRAFPNLKHLDLYSNNSADITFAIDLLATPFGRKLTTLGFSESLPIVLRALAPRLSGLPKTATFPTIEIRNYGNQAVVLFDPSRRAMKITLDGFVDMRAVGTNLSAAYIEDLQIEAGERAWAAVSNNNWRQPLQNVKKIAVARA